MRFPAGAPLCGKFFPSGPAQLGRGCHLLIAGTQLAYGLALPRWDQFWTVGQGHERARGQESNDEESVDRRPLSRGGSQRCREPREGIEPQRNGSAVRRINHSATSAWLGAGESGTHNCWGCAGSADHTPRNPRRALRPALTRLNQTLSALERLRPPAWIRPRRRCSRKSSTEATSSEASL